MEYFMCVASMKIFNWLVNYKKTLKTHCKYIIQKHFHNNILNIKTHLHLYVDYK